MRAKKVNSANERIKKSLRQGIKDIKMIEEGKLEGRPIEELFREIRESRGGARAGAGKKSLLQDKFPDELKKRVTVRVYPTQLKEIESKYGSLQSAIDGL